jgi:4-methylaminobutanoate oxidase (formaldehyde-forming)
MGEAPNLRNFFVAAGFNSLGILSGGGVGHVMARWIVDGHPPMDVWSVNLRRTHAWQDNDRFLLDRTVEALGIGYQDHWPFRQWESARGVKKSILHERLAAAGACFGEAAGWERPNWYARPGQEPVYAYGWGRQNWFANNAEEHRAVRERVGVFEQSSFTKLLVQGRDAVKVLNQVATADLDVPVGRCVYTQFLNQRGGIEADLTVTRLDAERFLVLTAAFTQTHVEAWIRNHTPPESSCVLTDVSDAYAMLNVQGPAARALLGSLSPDDFSNAGFPFATCRKIRIGYQTVLALRLTYVGELGWELYIPTPFALQVYDALLAAGKSHGLQHCGYHTLNSLRMEKAYRDWSHDIGPDDTPLEAGLAFTCAWDKPGGFIGRERLLAQRERGLPRRRLVQFLLEDPEPLVYHNEPIYRDGERVGYVTSGMFGHTLGAAVAMGYVAHPDGVAPEFVDSGVFEIELAERRVRARLAHAALRSRKFAGALLTFGAASRTIPICSQEYSNEPSHRFVGSTGSLDCTARQPAAAARRTGAGLIRGCDARGSHRHRPAQERAHPGGSDRDLRHLQRRPAGARRAPGGRHYSFGTEPDPQPALWRGGAADLRAARRDHQRLESEPVEPDRHVRRRRLQAGGCGAGAADLRPRPRRGAARPAGHAVRQERHRRRNEFLLQEPQPEFL